MDVPWDDVCILRHLPVDRVVFPFPRATAILAVRIPVCSFESDALITWMMIEQNRHAIENVSRMRELLNEHRKTGLFMLGGRIEILDGMLRTDKGELAAPSVNLL